jgi:hypothetical protein
VTQHGRGAAGPQETAARQQPSDPWPAYAPPGPPGMADDAFDDAFDDVAERRGQRPPAQEPPWEVDLRTDPPQQRYPSRRDLRDDRDRLGEAPFPAGPSTQELAVYRGQAPERHPAQPGLVPWEGIQDGPGEGGRGDRVRGSVERWSRWASGLGLPARDGSGYGRYAKADRLFPPAVWIAAGLGAAGLVGLLTGVLVSAPSGGAPGAAAAVTSTATVTVTEQVTQPPVTQTTTRTRTKTVTATTTAAAPAQAPAAGGTLGPGSQGGRVARLQADLAALGLFQAPPNGSYDQRTALGVQVFQAQHGVTGDPPGVAGPATLSAIDQALGR